MWDMTNVPSYTFTSGTTQRATYSEYYAMNCLKAGICIMVCGWLGNENLWGRTVTDSDYHNKAGYLEEQKRHQESNLAMGAVIELLNLLGRGF